MDTDSYHDLVREALTLLKESCPRLVGMCYWAGTSCISIEELGHRMSHDLDFHTLDALVDVRPVLAELRKAFADEFELVQAPDSFGSGFSGVLGLPSGNQITIEVLSNYEDVVSDMLVDSRTVPGISRISLKRYLADKMQCIAERLEARDLVDVLAVLKRHPELSQLARHYLGGQDSLLVVERLLSWTDQGIFDDLQPYSDIEPKNAIEARDLLLGWLKAKADQVET